MPGIWRLDLRCDHAGAVEPHHLRGLASRIFDERRAGHHDLKPWSVGIVTPGSGVLAVEFGVVDDSLARELERAMRRTDLRLGPRTLVAPAELHEITRWTWRDLHDADVAVDTLRIEHRSPAGRRVRSVGGEMITHPVLTFDAAVASWAQRWNASGQRGWNPLPAAPGVEGVVTSVAHLRGHTESIAIDRERFVGFVGMIEHRIHEATDEQRHWIHRLGRLGEVTGTGARTSIGAGATRVTVVEVAGAESSPGSRTLRKQP